MDWRAVGACFIGMIAVASAACQGDVYTKMVNKHISGGLKDASGIANIADCQAKCTNDRSCFAVDVKTSPFECYFLSDPSMPITTEAGVDHYNITRKCSTSSLDCTYLDYGAYRFTTAPSGSPVTFDGCAESCNIDGSSCLGFAATGTICQKAVDGAMLAGTEVNTTFKMMIKGSCSTACANTWAKFVDMSSSGGNLKLTSTTEQLCKEGCEADSTCTRVDLDGSNNCYYHTGTPSQASTSGITQYVLTRCSTVQETTTTSGCQIGWTPATDIHSPQGVMQTTLTTVAACQTGCVDLAGCLGVDFKGSQCWFHSDSMIFKNKATETGVTQYALDRCVGQVTSPTCNPTYDITQSRSSPNGVRQTSVNNLDMCKTACVDNAACVAFDYDNTQATPSCWLHTDITNLDEQRSTDRVTQYKIVRCPGVCMHSFTPFPNMHGLGGTFVSANTLATCQDNCFQNSACISIDFTPSNTCYFFTTPGYVKETLTGSTHYRIERCTTETTVAPGTTTSSGCQPGWTSAANMHSANGDAQSSFTSLTTCQQGCLADTNCLAIDVKDGNTCWFHTNANYVNTKTAETGVIQYALNRCVGTCQPMYKKTSGQSSPNGWSVESVTTEAGCKTACAGNMTCLAFDYNTVDPPKCWLHSNHANLNDKRSTANINQYILSDRCPGVCVNTWTTTPDTHGIGGTAVSANTWKSCQADCEQDAACVAVDFTSSSNACFFFTSTGYTKAAMSGVTHYVLTRCGTDTTTASSVSTTKSGCQVLWTNHTNMGSSGAMKETGFNTVDQCLNGCFQLAGCVAVDYAVSKTPNECWFHMNTFSQRRADTGVNQYVLDRCFSGTTAPGCIIAWANKTDTKSIGATERGVRTELSCMETCIADTSCVALDYDSSSNKCWLHMQADNVKVTVPAQGVKQFVLDRCASTGTTMPPGCGMPTTTKFENTHASNGRPRPEHNTLDKCAMACAADGTCLAFDYDTTGGTSCWFHDVVGTRSAQTGTNYYIIGNRCPGEAQECPLFMESKNMHASGGIQQSSQTTKDMCRSGCLANTDCDGYDFDTLTNGCFFFNQPTAANQLLDQNDVNHYELVCRAGQTVPSVIVTTDRGAMSTTTPAASCTPTWETKLDTQGRGGTQQMSINTLSECQAQCLATPACLAVDHVPSRSECWFFTSAYNLVPINTGGTTVNHYILRRCDSGTDRDQLTTISDGPTTRSSGTTRSSSCTNTWAKTVNTHGLGGVEDTSVNTLAGCQDSCIQSTCVAIDYMRAANRCWTFSSTSFTTKGDSALDHYQLSRCVV